MTYWRSFGYEWLRWPQLQLDGPGQDESKWTFRLKTGLGPEDVKGKLVLDVGCGSGRFLEVASRWGARWAVGLEPSAAHEAAARNLRGRRNVQVVQADLHDFKLGHHAGAGCGRKFDVVYCLGVLHHTPDPARAFRCIARLVKPGGLLCVWVYAADLGAWTRVTDLYRRVTTRLPWWLLAALCLLAGPWHYTRRIPGVGRWLWGLVPCSTHPKWRWRWLDTFDWYSPRYQHRHTVAEVKAWFLDAGFTDVEALGFPVSVRGRAPERRLA